MTPFGIYGYIFTKEMTFDLGTLTPRFNNLHEIKKEKCNGVNRHGFNRHLRVI